MSLWDRIRAHGAGEPWEPEHVLPDFKISPSGAIVAAGHLAELEALEQRSLEQREDARQEVRLAERADDAERIRASEQAAEKQFERERLRGLGLPG